MSELLTNDIIFVERIQEVARAAAGLRTLKQLLDRRSREQYVCKFRDAAIYLARKHTTLGVVRLGQLFGGRDASTVTAAYQREERRLMRNPPRKDGLTHQQWHDSLLAQVQKAVSVSCAST